MSKAVKSMSAKRKEIANRYLEHRLRGCSIPDIAAMENAKENQVVKLMNDALAELNERTMSYAYGVQQMELQRLDKLWSVAYEQAEAGDLQAVDRCLKIMERRSSLLGLDAPKHQVHHVANQEADKQTEKDVTPIRSQADLQQLGDALRRIGFDPQQLGAAPDGVDGKTEPEDAEIIDNDTSGSSEG